MSRCLALLRARETRVCLLFFSNHLHVCPFLSTPHFPHVYGRRSLGLVLGGCELRLVAPGVGGAGEALAGTALRAVLVRFSCQLL